MWLNAIQQSYGHFAAYDRHEHRHTAIHVSIKKGHWFSSGLLNINLIFCSTINRQVTTADSPVKTDNHKAFNELVDVI